MLRKTTFDLLISALAELEQIVECLEPDNENLDSALSEFESNIIDFEFSEDLTGFKNRSGLNAKNNPLELFPDE